MLTIHAAVRGDDLTDLAEAVGVLRSFQATCALGCGRPVPPGKVACGQCS